MKITLEYKENIESTCSNTLEKINKTGWFAKIEKGEKILSCYIGDNKSQPALHEAVNLIDSLPLK